MDAGRNTKKLLFLISDHLSGKKKFSKFQYLVTINNCNAERASAKCSIHLFPNPWFFPNTHSRRPGSETTLVDHILMYHASTNLDVCEENGVLYLNMKKLVSGEYAYMLGADNKRRWVRLR